MPTDGSAIQIDRALSRSDDEYLTATLVKGRSCSSATWSSRREARLRGGASSPAVRGLTSTTTVRCNAPTVPDAYDARFIYYFLADRRRFSYSTGARQRIRRRRNVRHSTSRAPRSISRLSNPTQDRRVLSAYDDLIENNNRRIKLLEEMAQRIYREWFVDFRYPGHEDVPLVDSEFGSDPAGVGPVECAVASYR